MGNNGTAVTCGDESGNPFAGFFLSKNGSQSLIKLDINPSSRNIINTSTPPVVVIRRNEDILECSIDGGDSYITRMASVASVVSGSPRLVSVPLMIGGYYDKDGNVGRAFYGRIKADLYFDVVDITE
jgi:hypothetical protein